MKTIYRWINHEQVPCEVVFNKFSIIYDSTAQTARVVDGEPDGSVYGTDYRPDAERYAKAIEAAAKHVPIGTPLSVERRETRLALRYDPPEVAARIAFDLHPLPTREEQEIRSQELNLAHERLVAECRAQYGEDWRRHALARALDADAARIRAERA